MPRSSATNVFQGGNTLMYAPSPASHSRTYLHELHQASRTSSNQNARFRNTSRTTGRGVSIFFFFSAFHFSRSLTLPTIFFSKKRERAPIAQTCRTHCYLKSHTNPTTRTGAVCALPCPHQRQGARAKSAKRRVLVQRQRDAVVVEHVVPLCSTGFCASVCNFVCAILHE